MKIEISDNKKWQYSLTIKMVLLAILGVFLLVPLEMIKSIIRERQKNCFSVGRTTGYFRPCAEYSCKGLPFQKGCRTI
jgi:hypothetical protein